MISYAIAQTLTPVTAPAGSGIPWWVWPLLGLLIVAAGFVWLKVKKPATAAQVQTTVSADVAALTAAIHKMVDAKTVDIHVMPGDSADAAVPAEPTVNPLQEPLDAANGKLAQIKAILDA